MAPRRIPRLLLALIALLFVSLPASGADPTAPSVEALRAKARATQDSKEAHKLWLPLAEQGDAEAQFEVGSHFHFHGGEISSAADWYMKAAKQGNIEAMIQLGHIADDTDSNEDEYNDEDRKNDTEAVRWWTKAADLGSDEARSQLAKMQMYGTGLPEDRVKARETLTALVAKGSDSARHFLPYLNRLEGVDEKTGLQTAVAVPVKEEKSPVQVAEQAAPKAAPPAAPAKSEKEILIDQLHAQLLNEFWSVSYPESRTEVLEKYVAALRQAHLSGPYQVYDNPYLYRSAIEPILKSQTVANPEMAEQVLHDWSRLTKDDEYSLKYLLPPEVRVAVEQRKDARHQAYEENKKIVEASAAKANASAQSDTPKKVQTQEELCAEKMAKSRFKRGLTVKLDSIGYVILESFDCSADEYIAWRPHQGDDSPSAPLMKKVRVQTSFGVFSATRNQYHRCDPCGGQGRKKVIVETTRTKELPFGYFSGIQTTSSRTTTTEEMRWCHTCDGRGVVLK